MVRRLINKKEGVSILLVFLITFAVLTSAILISDILIRQSRITKGLQNSELALLAAESAVEKVSYKVFKEHCQIGVDCAISGYLWDNGPYYEVIEDDIKPEVNSDGFWQITLSNNQSFSLYLDLNGVAYPSSVNISCSSCQSGDSDLIIFQEKVDDGTKSENIYSDLSSPIPLIVELQNNQLVYYYKVTIHNRSGEGRTYSLAWTGSLPVALKINQAKGTYKGYQRLIEKSQSRWQITGS